MTFESRPRTEAANDHQQDDERDSTSLPRPADSSSNGQHADGSAVPEPEYEIFMQDLDPDIAPTETRDPWAEAEAWFAAGHHPIPLPYRKKTPPPTGATGHKGVDAGLAGIRAHKPAKLENIGLRMSEDTVGIDVDKHGVVDGKGNEISGPDNLADAEAALGPLPRTWMTRGARDDGAGIRYFRLPKGTVLVGQVAPAIDVVQRHHRYACVWPSMHKTDVEYQTFNPDGEVVEGPMAPPAEWPELPAGWVAALSVRREPGKTGRPKKPFEGTQQEWRDTRVEPNGEPCAAVLAALERAQDRVAAGAGRHDTALKLTWELAHLGAEGHWGLSVALDTAEAWFLDVTDHAPDRRGEWFRMVGGAIHTAGMRGKTKCHCQDAQLPEGAVEVSNQADAAEWLADEIGTNHLAGVFVRGEKLVYTPRVGEDGYRPPKDERNHDGPAQVRLLGVGELARRVDFHYAPYRDLGEDGTTRALFPRPSADRVAAAPDLAPNLRRLIGVTHTPMMRPDGGVLDAPGYDDETGYLFLPEAGQEFPLVPREPSPGDVKAARELVLEMVDGFDFVTDSDKANYLGALLTPSLRLLLPPPYPMFGIGAPMKGSGKSFLARIVRIIHGGVFRVEFPKDEAEVSKSILGLLRDTTGPVIQFDNVKGVLRSGVLEGFLTSATFSDRLLGVNENPDFPNDRVIVMTGNSLTYGGDLIRRVVQTTIDPNMPNPEERTGFAIPNLMGWVTARRGELLAALLTLTRAWAVAGRPIDPAIRSDDYAVYMQGIGGILKHSGIKGTFNDPETKRQPESDDDEQWGTLLHALSAAFGTRAWEANEVPSHLRRAGPLQADSLPDELAEVWSRDQHGDNPVLFVRSLGRWLGFREGRWAGGLNVRRADGVSTGSASKKSAKWVIKHEAKKTL